jgi:hypothetical protein
MNLIEGLKMKGELTIVVRDESGLVKNSIHVPNLVVTAGKNFIASRIVGTASPIMSHMAIGSSSTAADVANTALGAELGRVALTSGTAASGVVQYVASFPAGTGTGGVQEAGIFNASSGGTMLCRTVFAVVNKGSDDSMTITWRVTVS